MSELMFYVDKERCSGCGECWESLPNNFAENSENLAEVHNTDGLDRKKLEMIMKSCIPKAIKWKK